ncbi:MAG: Mur ligase family protein [bacterium]
MKYQNLDTYVKYLHSFPRFSPAEYLSLDRIKLLLKKLGNPEKKLQGFQVAGTNGKGSVVAMLRAVLTEAGYKVGSFTSPHLVSYTERYKIGEKNISQTELAKIVSELKHYITEIEKETSDRVTWFEVMTVVAVLYFVRQKVEVAIFEVGLGGRFDATTVLPLHNKILTNVALDHTKTLGKTLTSIAFEKAAVVTSKKDKIVVGEQNIRIKSKIRQQVSKTTDKYYFVNSNNSILENINLSGTYFNHRVLDKLKTNLIGVQHPHHVSMCYEAIEQSGYKVSKINWAKGLQNVNWPGRFQIVKSDPVIVLDGAHNPAGIRILKKTLRALKFDLKYSVAIVAVKKVKEVRKIINLIATSFSHIIFPDLSSKKYLENLASGKDLKKYYNKGIVVSSIKEADKKAQQMVSKKGLIIHLGSLYYIGEYLRLNKGKSIKFDTMDDSDYLSRR